MTANLDARAAAEAELGASKAAVRGGVAAGDGVLTSVSTGFAGVDIVGTTEPEAGE